MITRLASVMVAESARSAKRGFCGFIAVVSGKVTAHRCGRWSACFQIQRNQSVGTSFTRGMTPEVTHVGSDKRAVVGNLSERFLNFLAVHFKPNS